MIAQTEVRKKSIQTATSTKEVIRRKMKKKTHTRARTQTHIINTTNFTLQGNDRENCLEFGEKKEKPRFRKANLKFGNQTIPKWIDALQSMATSSAHIPQNTLQ